MTDLFDSVESDAVLSECGAYRYTLSRRWGAGPSCVFIMLNPSTADATEDDPTIRRCVSFSKSWGYGGLIVVNIFAFRATNPKELLAAQDPVGPENAAYIKSAAADADSVICAWGANKCFGQDIVVLKELAGVALQCLGTTKTGAPKHPLYLPKNAVRKCYSKPC